ncbi:MAG: DUF1800 domain-containing protein [Gammaproteobacteria bacterium]
MSSTAPIPADVLEIRHLAARSGLGPRPEEIEVLAKGSYEKAVKTLLKSTKTRADVSPPGWIDEPVAPPRQMRQMSQATRQQLMRKRRQHGMELKAWWYQEMLTTDSPLTERMTLFWHNHFTSDMRKVRMPQLLYRQNVLLREQAFGNFGDLLHAILKDPAMLVYLDNVTNFAGNPNENLARELMELFTLGEGNYNEHDVKAAARALSGRSIDRQTMAYRFYPRRHDATTKRILGSTGRFDGDDLADILLEQPHTARFITEKLWREFISPVPDDAEVNRLAAVFRDEKYEIKPLLIEMFTSDAFLDPVNRGTLVKSPVELLVGTLRIAGNREVDGERLARAGMVLGQDIFNPPNVKGWPGGNAWITANTLLAREELLSRFTRGRPMPSLATKDTVDSYGYAKVRAWLLPLEPVDPPAEEGPLPAYAAALMQDPVYQLK